jgi:hypothetical protein
VESFLSGLFGIEPLEQISKSSWTTSVWRQLGLFANCLSLLCLLSFSIQLMKKVICINFTKPLRFPNDEGLVGAMGKSQDLLGHLATFDFCHLAATSKDRRAEFYVISQPGKTLN